MFGVWWAHPGRGGGQLGRRPAGLVAGARRRFRGCNALGREADDPARQDARGVRTRERVAAAAPAIGSTGAAVPSTCDAVAPGARRSVTSA